MHDASRGTRAVDVSGISSLLLGIVLLILVAPVGVQAVAQSSLVPWWWTPAVAAPLLAAVPLAFTRRGRAGALLAWAATVTAMTTMPLVAERTVTADPWPMLLYPAMSAAVVLVNRNRGWGDAPLMLGLLGAAAWCRLQTQTDPDLRLLTIDTVYGAAIWAVTRLLFHTLSEVADRAEMVHAHAVQEFAHARAAEATVRAAQVWDSYLHDEVIAGLTVISAGSPGGDSTAARAAARRISEGASEVDTDGVPAPALTTGTLESVLHLLPAAETDLRVGDQARPLPTEVRRAVLEALSEALRNVDRHAHPDGRAGRTVVRLRHDAEGVEARVTDDGVGFDVARVDPLRLGMAISVQGRMDAVGGSARIASRPGLGTSVVLRWPAR